MTDKFLLLNSINGFWIKEHENMLMSTTEDGIRLKKEPRNIKDEIGSFGGLALPTGMAVDDYGNIYIVDKENSLILKYNLCTELPVPVKCVGGKGSAIKQFSSPTGIVISNAGNVYISDSDNHRIQVFTVKGFVLKDVWGKIGINGYSIKGTEKGAFNNPWDLAVNSHEYIFIVDRGNNRIQEFSQDGECLKTFGEAELDEPLHIAIDKNDFIYVMDKGVKVKRYSQDGTLKDEIQAVDEVMIDENDRKYVIDCNFKDKLSAPLENLLEEIEYIRKNAISFFRPQLYVDTSGNVHYDYKYSKIGLVVKHKFKLEKNLRDEECVIPKNKPVPGVYYYKDKLIINSENIPEPKKEETDYLENGWFFSEPLDSKEYKCNWYKIILDAVIPLGTSVTVQTYTSETKKDFMEIKNLDESFWQTIQKNAKDFLIQSSPGRYLWLKITLKSNKKKTPLVKSIRIYYPRITYLEYLPAIYQQDPASKLFLEQFLSIFAHFFEGIEDEIDNMVRYFIPGATPVEFLPWLASWLALSLDDKWHEEKKRIFIKKAGELFKKRGTLNGMREILGIFIGDRFQIIEHFKLRRKHLILSNNSKIGCNSFLWGIESSLGVNTKLSGFELGDSKEPVLNPFQVHAHEFSILIPAKYVSSDEDERKLRKIINLWKPAHTRYYLCKIEPRFRIGIQSVINANTIIGKYFDVVLAQESTLGREIILGEDIGEAGSYDFVLNKDTRMNKETIIK